MNCSRPPKTPVSAPRTEQFSCTLGPCLSHNARLPSQEIASAASCEFSRCRKAEFKLFQVSEVTSFTLRWSDHTHFQEQKPLAEHSSMSNESHCCLSTTAPSNLPIQRKACLLFVCGYFQTRPSHKITEWRYQPEPTRRMPKTYHAALAVTLALY